MTLRSFIAAVALLMVAVPAHAQNITQALATATCGTPGRTITAGSPGPIFINTSGYLCVAGIITTTPSGTQDVNLTQILGAAPSLTNPLWVFPATGATFPVSGTVAFSNTTIAVTNAGTFAVQNTAATPAGTNAIGSVLPNPATSTQTKVTIATGSTYQQYLALNASRKGCTIQFWSGNTSTHTGYIFFGSAPADTTTSFTLTPGQSLSCAAGPIVLTDAIQLTSSNNSDVFIVNSQ